MEDENSREEISEVPSRRPTWEPPVPVPTDPSGVAEVTAPVDPSADSKATHSAAAAPAPVEGGARAGADDATAAGGGLDEPFTRADAANAAPLGTRAVADEQWRARTGDQHAPGASTRESAPRRRVPVAAIVAAAVLSAVLSSGGTYAVVRLTAPPASSSTAQDASLASTASAASTSSTSGAAQTASGSNAIVNVASEASKSVVTITSNGMTGYSPFSVPETGVGSGFIVSTNGLILTANHVVTGAQSLTVTLPSGRNVPATVVSTDPSHDVALIKVSATGLTPLPLGDSNNLTVGETVVAVGSPLGTFYDTVTNGIVSALNRTISVSETGSRQQTQLSGLIQTDAPINPGNSGGPLLDTTGHVIGLVDAQASGAQGVGFAVPINAGKALLNSAPTA